MIERAPAETAEEALTPNLHREIVLGSPAVRPSGSQLQSHGESSKKRRAGRGEGEKESRPARKKKKTSKAAVEPSVEPSSGGGRVAGVEASGRWFSKISCGAGESPKLDEMHRRQEYESCAIAGVQYIAQMNRMVTAYEADLKSAAETREQFEQSIATYAGIEASLQDRVAGLEKEKEDALGRAEVYERKYDEQYAELLTLRDQVKAAKEAEANLEAELRRKVLAESEEADAARRSECLRILGELRGNTTTRMLHFSQAENNLEFIKDLLSEEPPELQSEKTILEASLVKLEGSNDAFDKALDDLERLLDPSALVPPVEPLTHTSPSEGARIVTVVEGDEKEDKEIGDAEVSARVEERNTVDEAATEPEGGAVEEDAEGVSQNAEEI